MLRKSRPSVDSSQDEDEAMKSCSDDSSDDGVDDVDMSQLVNNFESDSD